MAFDFQEIEGYDYTSLAARFRLPEEKVAERTRPAKASKKPKPARPTVAADLAEQLQTVDDEFRTTYRPARYEEVFLRDSLQPFYIQGLITDVLAQVKGGKEANVYLCQAHPNTGLDLIAAKVYRPRQFRNLRNDVMYREGRELISASGTIKNRDNREMRAIQTKTSFGAELTHSSWLMHEYVTLERLHGLGAAVPKPLGAGANAILMAYVGDRHRPAPVLHGVALAQREAERLCDEVLRNIELMLAHGMIHGDLSAYNVLYWEGQVTLIDFPQVTMSETNHNSYRIFQRDVRRVCEYFASQGVVRNGDAIAPRLWERYVRLAPDRTMLDE